MDEIAQKIADVFGLSHEYGFLIIGFIAGCMLTAMAKGGKDKSYNSTQNTRASAFAATHKTGSDAHFSMTKTNLIAANKINHANHGSVTVSEKVLDIGLAKMSEIQELIKKNDKISAIKLIREATGLGLAESKGIVDSMERKGS